MNVRMVKGRIDRIVARWAFRAAVLAVGGLAALVALAAWSALEKERFSREELRVVEVEHESRAARERAALKALESLATPRGIEAAIRERYPVVKPGEEVIILVPAEFDTASTTPFEEDVWDSFRNWLGL